MTHSQKLYNTSSKINTLHEKKVRYIGLTRSSVHDINEQSILWNRQRVFRHLITILLQLVALKLFYASKALQKV